MQGKNALVTGGSRGIGKTIALELAGMGVNIAFTYHSDQKSADATAAELAALGVKVVPVQVDSRDFSQVKEAVGKCVEELGSLHYLVNNAGVKLDKNLVMMSPEEWATVIDTNLTGYFNFSRNVIFTFMKQKYGRIVNVSSVSGLIGLPGQVNYSSSKAGIIGLTKALAKEVAKYNITVNAVAPGFIETEMTASLDEKVVKKYLEAIPAGRFGEASEVAKLVKFLLSDDAAYITGHVIPIDGGLAI